ncbi:MAG: cyclase [Frankiales bacterium]|nr:cyclase [Frankiales bacterium]
MSTITKAVEVAVPVRTAYDQWTQFERFPQFMEGIESVRQVDDKTLHWTAKIAGVSREWDAQIVQQVPDQIIAWRSLAGTKNDGVVDFLPGSGERTTTVTVTIEYEPSDTAEKLADWLNIVDRRVAGDLERFKNLIEGQGRAEGAWRGEVKPTGEVSEPAAQ